MDFIIGLVAGLFVGGASGGCVVWLTTRLAKARAIADSVSLQAQLDEAVKRFEDMQRDREAFKDEAEKLRNESLKTSTTVAALRAKLDAANERLAEQTDIERTLLDKFKVMANEVISTNNDVFVKAADEKIGSLVKQAKSDFSLSKDAVQELVKPLSDELKRIETDRSKSEGSLKQQLETLTSNNLRLEQETRNLSTALKRPEVRGTWGEIQLKRVVELAGMANYCDYEEQVSVASDDGSRDRPDMVVRMPNERTLVVDAKVPMRAYLDAVESGSELERRELIQQHAQQVKERARNLARKSYQQKFNSPDFVVMFLPGEVFLQPALEKDPDLLDWAMQQNVVIATPTTLMALLKTVAMGWREAQLAEDAKRIGKLGEELHDRLYTFAQHMNKMRDSLSATVDAFNASVGSLEGRVLVQARRFKEFGISSNRELPELKEVDKQARLLTEGNN